MKEFFSIYCAINLFLLWVRKNNILRHVEKIFAHKQLCSSNTSWNILVHLISADFIYNEKKLKRIFPLIDYYFDCENKKKNLFLIHYINIHFNELFGIANLTTDPQRFVLMRFYRSPNCEVIKINIENNVSTYFFHVFIYFYR